MEPQAGHVTLTPGAPGGIFTLNEDEHELQEDFNSIDSEFCSWLSSLKSLPCSSLKGGEGSGSGSTGVGGASGSGSTGVGGASGSGSTGVGGASGSGSTEIESPKSAISGILGGFESFVVLLLQQREPRSDSLWWAHHQTS